MDEGESQAASKPFTLHLDKALSSTVEKAAWNPEKDLLAMVTTDQQLILHRFNWQRLWAVSPERRATSLCWRPDGKALAVGHEDGTISLHDVENGNVFRQTFTHESSVECLTWVEEGQSTQGGSNNLFFYEDRTPRFFPAPLKAPAMPGTAPAFDVSGASSSGDDQQTPADSRAVIKSTQHRVNILCSGDKNGVICLNVFGVFLIGKVNLGKLEIKPSCLDNLQNKGCTFGLVNPLVSKVSLSDDLCQMVVLCHGKLVACNTFEQPLSNDKESGLFCIRINSELIGGRSKELGQVALQASSIEELLDALQASINVMQKQWSDAMSSFTEKFQALSVLLREHGSHGTPQDEFMGLLACGLPSMGIHQFLAVSLGEGGLKRLSKAVNAGVRELHVIISEHLQPVAEILAFRIGELRGLSRWRARMRSIGLDEKLVDQAMEDAGMVLVQVERLLRVVSNIAGQFRMFFIWLTKLLRQLNNEQSPQSDQLPAVNSEIVAEFLRTEFVTDFVGPHLAPVSDGITLHMDSEEVERLEELALMGGFRDCKFFENTLNKQISLLVRSCEEAFCMPSKVVSPKLCCEDVLLLCELRSPYTASPHVPVSLAYYEDKESYPSIKQPPGEPSLVFSTHYICYQMQSMTSDGESGFIGIIRKLRKTSKQENQRADLEVTALRIQEGLFCIDLALYKGRQIVLLLGKGDPGRVGIPAEAWLMVLDTSCFPFMRLDGLAFSINSSLLHVCLSMGTVVDVGLTNGKARLLSYSDAVAPLAVSASRGLACIFAGQRRALLYDLEEDEDDGEEDTEMD